MWFIWKVPNPLAVRRLDILFNLRNDSLPRSVNKFHSTSFWNCLKITVDHLRYTSTWEPSQVTVGSSFSRGAEQQCSCPRSCFGTFIGGTYLKGFFPSSFPVLTYSNHVRHLAPGVSSFHLVAEARVGFLRKFWSKTCPACGWLFHLGVWTLGLIVSHLLVARAPRRDSRSSTKTKQHVGKPNENVVLGGWNHDGHEMKWNFSKVLNQICSYEGLNPNWFPEFFFGEIFDLMRDQIDISCLISPLLYFHNYVAALDIPLKQHGLSPTKAFWDSVPNHPVKRWPSDLDILQVSKKMILLGPTFQMDPDI